MESKKPSDSCGNNAVFLDASPTTITLTCNSLDPFLYKTWETLSDEEKKQCFVDRNGRLRNKDGYRVDWGDKPVQQYQGLPAKTRHERALLFLRFISNIASSGYMNNLVSVASSAASFEPGLSYDTAYALIGESRELIGYIQGIVETSHAGKIDVHVQVDARQKSWPAYDEYIRSLKDDERDAVIESMEVKAAQE